MPKISFQFDSNLQYQHDAVRAAVELFRGLPRKTDGLYSRLHASGTTHFMEPERNIDIVEGQRLLDNLRRVQMGNGLFADGRVRSNHFTIEMETGTGKTYVYLRTILELHRQYGFRKFMIVVPSVAIRKGVETSIAQLHDHFKALYDIDILSHSFVYDSSKLRTAEQLFVSSTQLSICILNIQAFNSDTKKIRKEDEYGQILWENIKIVRPIVIIDEPQKIEGTAKKKSASLKAIEDISPLFTLRYSATHKQLYHQIYKLDSFAAFEQNLVKGITVKTINSAVSKDSAYIRYVRFTADLKARIEIFHQAQGGPVQFKAFNVTGGDDLYELSGRLEQYRDYRVFADPHKEKPLVISKKTGRFELAQGESTEQFESLAAIRIQIRLTIQKHLQKQFEILESGKRIKVLSLFFIDSVAKVRDKTTADGRGEYLRIFDEEYAGAIQSERFAPMFKKYASLFPKFNQPTAVREGYFAIDKKKNEVDVEGWQSESSENKILKKSQEDIDRGVELILSKKDELISFQEPLAFIFSHSALREGWDNPNVFVLCTLKTGGSEIAKKQEIGRGLRLPVNADGVRSTDRELNELTVIANDSYEHFAETLQRDFNEQNEFDVDEVTPDLLQETLIDAGVPKSKILPELVETFRQELFNGKIINQKSCLTRSAEEVADIDFCDPTLKEHEVKIRESFIQLVREKGSRKIPIKNGDIEDESNGFHDYVSEEAFKKLFKTMIGYLSKRTFYKLELDKDKFIRDSIDHLNELLSESLLHHEYTIETGNAEYTKTHEFSIKKGDVAILKDQDAALRIKPRGDFRLVNEIMYHTNLPRLAIVKILKGLKRKDLLGDQDILDRTVQFLIDFLARAKAESVIGYELIEGYEFDEKTIIELDILDREMFDTKKRVYKTSRSARKAVNLFYLMDSDGEFDFAKSLEDDDHVLLFTKLKKGGFVIDTPYGNYSPDWAIVCRDDAGETKLYFVIETKCGKKEENLTDVEKVKIRCGKLHFKAVSELVHFDWVSNYDEFKCKYRNV